MSLPPNYTGSESLLAGGQGAAPPLIEMRGGGFGRGGGIRWANHNGKALEAVRYFKSTEPVGAFESNEAEPILLDEVIGPLPPSVKDKLKMSMRKYIMDIEGEYYIRKIDREDADESNANDEDMLESFVDTYREIKDEEGKALNPISGDDENIVTLKPKLVRRIRDVVKRQIATLKKQATARMASEPDTDNGLHMTGGDIDINGYIGPLPNGVKDQALKMVPSNYAGEAKTFFSKIQNRSYIAKLNKSNKNEQELINMVANYNIKLTERELLQKRILQGEKLSVAKAAKQRELTAFWSKIVTLVKNQLNDLKTIGKLTSAAPAVPAPAPAPAPAKRREVIEGLPEIFAPIATTLKSAAETLSATPINYGAILPAIYSLSDDQKRSLIPIRKQPGTKIPTDETLEKLLGVASNALKYAAELKESKPDLKVNVSEALKTLKSIEMATKNSELTKEVYSSVSSVLTKINGLLGERDIMDLSKSYLNKVTEFLFRLPTLRSEANMDPYSTPIANEAVKIGELLKGSPLLTQFTAINTLFNEIVRAKLADPNADISKLETDLKGKLSEFTFSVEQTPEEGDLSKQLEGAQSVILGIKGAPITKDNAADVNKKLADIKGVIEAFKLATADKVISAQLRALLDQVEKAHAELLGEVGSIVKSMKDLEAVIMATAAAKAAATAAKEATTGATAAATAIQNNTDPAQISTLLSDAEKAISKATNTAGAATKAAEVATTTAATVATSNPAESAAATEAAKEATDAAAAAEAAALAVTTAKDTALKALRPEEALALAKEAAVKAEAAATKAEAAAVAGKQAAARAAAANSMDAIATATKEAEDKHKEASEAAEIATISVKNAAEAAEVAKTPEAKAESDKAAAAKIRADEAANKAEAAALEATSFATIKAALAAAAAAAEAAQAANEAANEAGATTDPKLIDTVAKKAEEAAAKAEAAANAALTAKDAANKVTTITKDPLVLTKATAAAKAADEAAQKAIAAAKAAADAAKKLRTPPVAPPGMPSDDYSNAAIRGRLAAETRAKFAQALNIYGDKFDLNSSIEYQYSHKPLKRFLADYGIGPDYQEHTDAIIRAFFTVFPNPSSGEAVGPAAEVHTLPEFHVICAFLQYRILTLRFEIQLTMRSTERRTALEQIVKKLQNLLKGGKCGSVNTALAIETMTAKEEYEKATADAKTAPGTKLSAMDGKLDKILADLTACCEKLSESLKPGGTFSAGMVGDIQKIIDGLKTATSVPAP